MKTTRVQSITDWRPTVASALLIAHFTLAPLVLRSITTTAGLIAIVAALTGWRGLKSLPPASRWLFAGFIFYVVIALLSLVNNENWHDAGERFEKYHPFLFAIPLMGWLALFRDRLEQTLLIGLTGAGLSSSAVALYEKFGMGVERAGYLTGLEPNVFGHLGSLTAIVLLGFALLSPSPRHLRILWFLAASGAIYAMLASGTRGAVLAFVAGAIGLLGIWALHDGLNRRKLILLIGMMLFVASSVALTLWLSTFWQEHWLRMLEEPGRFLAGDTRYTSTGARATMWIAGWKIALENLWLGTGIGDVLTDFSRLMDADELPRIGTPTFHLHNIYLDALASTGVIGLLSMLVAVFVLPLRWFVRSLREPGFDATAQAAAIIGIAVVVNGIVFGVTYSWLYVRDLHFYLPLLLALLVLSAPTEVGE